MKTFECPKYIRNYIKIMLGTPDPWLAVICPSEPAYYIADCLNSSEDCNFCEINKRFQYHQLIKLFNYIELTMISGPFFKIRPIFFVSILRIDKIIPVSIALFLSFDTHDIIHLHNRYDNLSGFFWNIFLEYYQP